MPSTKDEGSQCLTLKPKNVEIREELQLRVPIQSCLQCGLPSPDPLKGEAHSSVHSFICSLVQQLFSDHLLWYRYWFRVGEATVIILIRETKKKNINIYSAYKC